MRTHILLPLLPLIVGAAACQAPQDPDLARVSGHVEATEVQISPEVGGRIVDLPVSEGDRVAAGDVVARLDTRDLELQLDRARAERAAADAQLRLLQAGARPQDIRQAEAQVAAAQAEAAAAQAELTAAEADLARFEALLRANAGSVKQRDDARVRADVARQRLRAAEERGRAAREVLSTLQAGARSQEVDAARARVAVIDAQIAALENAAADATVTTSVGGIVTDTLLDAGEMAAPRMPLLVVTDLDNAWANLFVPEPVIPRVTLGQPAIVFTDAGTQLTGTVSYVSPQAEFTPRNVQTQDERSRLVYRIRVAVDNREGILKPGMPVDAELPLQ